MKRLVGAAALPFQLQDTNNRLHRLSDYSGRFLLLVFHRHLS